MLQVVYFLICFGVTWIPIAGVLFPLLFFILIAIREHVLPKFFPPEYLKELDAAEYEEIAGVPKVNYVSYLFPASSFASTIAMYSVYPLKQE